MKCEMMMTLAVISTFFIKQWINEQAEKIRAEKKLKKFKLKKFKLISLTARTILWFNFSYFQSFSMLLNGLKTRLTNIFKTVILKTESKSMPVALHDTVITLNGCPLNLAL